MPDPMVLLRSATLDGAVVDVLLADGVAQHFNGVDQRFDGLDGRLERIEGTQQQILDLLRERSTG
jgi:hypothetical protein